MINDVFCKVCDGSGVSGKAGLGCYEAHIWNKLQRAADLLRLTWSGLL